MKYNMRSSGKQLNPKEWFDRLSKQKMRENKNNQCAVRKTSINRDAKFHPVRMCSKQNENINIVSFALTPCDDNLELSGGGLLPTIFV